MHTLHIAFRDASASDVRPVKAVRAARKALGKAQDASLERSLECVKEAREKGFALVADSEDVIAADQAAALLEAESSGVLQAFVDKTDDWMRSRFNPVGEPEDVTMDETPATPATLSPTDAGYRTVIVFMGGAQGDQGRTLEMILNMKANFPENPLYTEALVSLAGVYPWVKNVAAQVGAWPS